LKILETDRLVLRQLVVEDDAFIFDLLNDPGWLRFIGDRGIRTLDDARNYILQGPVAMYARHGFGLYLTARKQDGVPMGLCGLLKRDGLADVDIGYAFLPQFRGQGYAAEAAAAVMDYGKNVLGLARIVAITAPGNERSAKVLEKLGLSFTKMVTLPGDESAVKLFTPIANG
jgi:RimJ/RimL family protein N-acetyltransferase